jgi:DNA-binding LytR/AlgR family response regulator
MSKLNCIAIDDEPFALEIMADDIQKVPLLNLVGTFSNPLDAWQLIKQGKVDLIFLDIQMPTLTGMQFLKTLPTPPMVIFTTAFQQYALEGFDLDVVDYLLKPIPFERFLRAVNKAQERFQMKPKENIELIAEEATFFFIHVEYKQIKLYFDDILYIEGLKDYVKIFLKTQTKPLLTRLNLKSIEAKLPTQQFYRVHNSYLVSLSKISSFKKTKLYIEKQEIPIGKKYAESFEQKYHPK